MVSERDRLRKLLDPLNTTYNGIDFVEVASADERTLRVHFLNGVPLKGRVSHPAVTGGEVVKSIAVNPIKDATDWSSDAEGRPVLTLTVSTPGDFSLYLLTLESLTLDPFYDQATFTFKAACPADQDCVSPAPDCPVPPSDAPPIDYLAKDFLSFRKALSDFSARRYPRWHERSEADAGVMFMESLSALADDLSYTQDRVAAEVALPTATQRRSIIRLARLVDYEPTPAISAGVVLQFDVVAGPIPAGIVVSAQGADGTTLYFETGTGLNDTTNYTVDPAWNRGLQPYFWDDSTRCLLRGATEMWIAGHGHRFIPGMALLIETDAQSSADPPLRQIVHLTPTRPDRLDHALEEVDALFGHDVTHIRWSAADVLTDDRDLTGNRTRLAGNIVPATQGRRFLENFAIEQEPPQFAGIPLAMARLGANSSADSPLPQYQYTIRGGRLAWVVADQLDAKPTPEITLVQLATQAGQVPAPWAWTRRLLDADPFSPAFTVDPGAFRTIARNSDGSQSVEYAGNDGDTIRFGDGVFGPIPETGAVMQARYRIADGAAGNVAADSIRSIEPTTAVMVSSVTNPFPAMGGSDQEPDESVRRLAPQAFRARQYRAVRREDYELAAERLPWVLTAGTVFRWTGSWLTVFTTADPRGREGVPPQPRSVLIDLLNRYRLAGYESYVPEPVYVAVDIAVTVCAKPDAYRGDVKTALLERLGTGVLASRAPAFFNPDQFTFGTPLERSRLEAVIQASPGVAGVLSVEYRRRGTNPLFVDLLEEAPVMVGAHEILRVDNDPSRPEMGSLRVYVEGGK